MKTKSLLPLACLVALAVGAGSAMAAPVQYTSKTLWQAAVASMATPVVAEDFNSDAVSTHSTPFTTFHGLGLLAASTLLTGIQVTNSTTPLTLNNGTQRLHFRDFTAGLNVVLPSPSFAFGFDYGTNDVGWKLSAANGVAFTFPNGIGTAGFIGYIDTPSSLYSLFTLTGPSGFQGGLQFDNVLVAASVPEPQSYALFALGLASVALTRRRKKAAADGAWPELATGRV